MPDHKHGTRALITLGQNCGYIPGQVYDPDSCVPSGSCPS